MLAAYIPALQQSPLAMGAQRKMRVFKHTIASEKRIKFQATRKNFLPPDGTGGCHEVHFADASERWLHVGVDRITGFEVVAARFIDGQQAQSTIPTPATSGAWVEVLIHAVADDSAYLKRMVVSKHLRDLFEKIGFEPDIVVDQSNKVAPGGLDAHVPLDRGASAVANVMARERYLAKFLFGDRTSGLFSVWGSIDQNQLERRKGLKREVLQKFLDFLRPSQRWCDDRDTQTTSR